MYFPTKTLSELMEIYNIANLSHGAKEDKLGDVFEDYVVKILTSSPLLKKAVTNQLNLNDTDEYIFHLIYEKIKFFLSEREHINAIPEILSINASRDIEHRITGGNPKTDVIADITTQKKFPFPISIKHTTAEKVAMAEFDVQTIVDEVGISDDRLIKLLEKHQNDASAKNFSREEKEDLKSRLGSYREKFVRWVITGTPVRSTDLRFPELLLKFRLNKDDDILKIECFTTDEYVKTLIYDKHGNVKKGGFGTGLSWTYATGSKGKKIQFKG